MLNRDQLRSDRRALAHTFPLAFIPQGSALPKLPLKIGLRADILERGVMGEDGTPLTEMRIRAAVADYCRGPKYQRAASAGGQRFDLDGQPAGEIAEGERQFHAAKLRRLMRPKRKVAPAGVAPAQSIAA